MVESASVLLYVDRESGAELITITSEIIHLEVREMRK